MKMLMMLSALFLLPLLAMATATRVSMEQPGHLDHPDHRCVYTLFVKTGDWPFAGTDSVISVSLFDKAGNKIVIPNLKNSGLMGANWHYFQLGNLDIFSRKDRCLKSAPCKIALTSDGSGILPDWLCSNVQVTKSAYNMTSTTNFFKVDQWITPANPTYIVDNCPAKSSIVAESHGHGGLPLPIQTEFE